MRVDHIPPRPCPICQHPIVQRPGERDFDYRRRQTCSRACRYTLIQQSLHQRKIEERHARSPEPGTIVLLDGTLTYVDPEDHGRAMLHDWRIVKGARRGKEYVGTQHQGRLVYLHRFILRLTPDDPDVDHIDGDTRNNRRSNLRLASRQQNARNRRLSVSNTSGYKGVTWHQKERCWRSQIYVDGTRISLGGHATPEDAALAYDAAAREVFGVFARLNFPRAGEQAA